VKIAVSSENPSEKSAIFRAAAFRARAVLYHRNNLIALVVEDFDRSPLRVCEYARGSLRRCE